jgi:hypothetical protein
VDVIIPNPKCCAQACFTASSVFALRSTLLKLEKFSAICIALGFNRRNGKVREKFIGFNSAVASFIDMAAAFVRFCARFWIFQQSTQSAAN